MMQYIKETARETAEQTGNLIRAQVETDLLKMKVEITSDVGDMIEKKISSELERHFGDMSPSEHTNQHFKMNEHLTTFGEIKKIWFKRAVGFLTTVAIAGVISFTVGLDVELPLATVEKAIPTRSTSSESASSEPTE